MENRGLEPKEERRKGCCFRQAKGLGEGEAPAYDCPQLRWVGDGSTALRSFPKESEEPGREEAGGWEAKEMDPGSSPGARGAEGVEGGCRVLTG